VSEAGASTTACAGRAPTAVRGLRMLPRSVTVIDELQLALARDARRLVLVARARDARRLAGFDGTVESCGAETVAVGPASARNAAALRELVPWLSPQPLGMRGSVGLGDRLGLATAGHVRALRGAGAGLAPIFAQQSVRELDRTNGTPDQVLDAAMWGIFAEGWREPFGADADHLKSAEHVDRFLRCGYTLYTIDPGDYVRDEAQSADVTRLREAFDALPWERLRDTPREMLGRHADRPLALPDRSLTPAPEDVLRAAAKYGEAIAHVSELFEHLRERAPSGAFEVEISLDETATPTTHFQHAFVARELHRLGVSWVSLAPRYVGDFEKGIDYIGDVHAFADDFAAHAQIAEALGRYKLSVHSGSDKFSIYPLVAALAPGRVHLKTSGTSYLEALRVIALHEPALLRRIYALALTRFAEDRESYHLSIDFARLPGPDELRDAELPALLGDNDSRQLLHVTFGSVLGGELGDELRERLAPLAEQYAAALERHLGRHLRPFASHTAPR
jgi:tagaturonate epimerase